jgi:hypothetical protein
MSPTIMTGLWRARSALRTSASVAARKTKTGGGSLGATARKRADEEDVYLRFASVKSDDSLTTKVELHQLDEAPKPLIAVGASPPAV